MSKEVDALIKMYDYFLIFRGHKGKDEGNRVYTFTEHHVTLKDAPELWKGKRTTGRQSTARQPNRKTAHRKTVHRKTVHRKTAHSKTDHRKTGHSPQERQNTRRKTWKFPIKTVCSPESGVFSERRTIIGWSRKSGVWREVLRRLMKTGAASSRR